VLINKATLNRKNTLNIRRTTDGTTTLHAQNGGLPVSVQARQ